MSSDEDFDHHRSDSSEDTNLRINRRSVLGTLGVAGAGFIAGCTGGSGENGPGGSGGTGVSGGRLEGQLVFADPQRPPTLDPHAVDPTNTNSSYAYQGYETLVYFSAEDTGDTVELVPNLATEVPTSENGLITGDGLVVEFPLREGVMFHTGEEMTAEDVRYSWERSMTMGLAPGSSSLSDSVDSMEVVDDYTFRVTLSRATTPIFLSSVVTDPAATIVSKAAVEENGGFAEGEPNEWLAQNSAGTGPYVLGDRTPSAQMWDEHVDYWDEAGITSVRHEFIGDVSSRVAQLAEGDLDYVYISVGDTSEVEGIDGVEILSGVQINPGGINFNFEIPYGTEAVDQIAGDDTVPPDFFQDRAVRKAFAHVIPWDIFIDNVLDGYGGRTNGVHVPGIFGYDPNAPQFEQDLDLVQDLLEQAGYWQEGFTVTLHNENISEFERLNLLIKDEFERLNDRITINTVSEPEGRAVERHAADPPEWPAEVHGLLPIGTDPTPYYKFFAHPDGDMGSRTRCPDYIDPRIPELISQTETETDQDARLEQLSELQRLWYEEAPNAFGYAPEEVFPHRDCIDSTWVSAWSRPHFKYWSTNC